MGRRRGLIAPVLVGALLVGATGVAPAHAAESVAWSTVPGFPVTVDDVTVTWETGISTGDPFGVNDAYLDPVPVQRPNILNDSDETRFFGFGIDVETQGVIEPLWDDDTFGGIGDGVGSVFAVALAPGESLHDIDTGIPWQNGVPAYTGRTGVVYELSELPTAENDPVPTELARYSAPGGFVPVRFEAEQTGDSVPPVGQRALVVGPDGAVEEPELFPGVAATVEASGLPANLPVELWIAPDLDYFFFALLGGNLPDGARQVGTATTGTDGALSATFTVPSDVPIDTRYQLVAGVRGDRYWPAGTYGGFRVMAPQVTDAATATATDTRADVDLGITQVSFEFPAGQGSGTWTATQSATGPVPQGFQIAGTAQLYYHLDTTAEPAPPVTVCIAYDTGNIPGAPPRLYHFESDPPRWVDITTVREPGRVCGSTSGLSPFVLGYPPVIDDGSKTRPATGVLSSDNGHDNGLQDGAYTITLNLWSGENARIVRLLENGQVVAQQDLVRNSPKAQRAVFPISGKVNGTYTYTAELENSRGVTTTKPLNVKVTQAAPGKPELTATSPQNGRFTLTANMWWGTNATAYRFLEGTTQVAAGTLTAATPNAQKASVVLNKPKGTYTYTVEFSNAAGITRSAPVTVRIR